MRDGYLKGASVKMHIVRRRNVLLTLLIVVCGAAAACDVQTTYDPKRDHAASIAQFEYQRRCPDLQCIPFTIAGETYLIPSNRYVLGAVDDRSRVFIVSIRPGDFPCDCVPLQSTTGASYVDLMLSENLDKDNHSDADLNATKVEVFRKNRTNVARRNVEYGLIAEYSSPSAAGDFRGVDDYFRPTTAAPPYVHIFCQADEETKSLKRDPATGSCQLLWQRSGAKVSLKFLKGALPNWQLMKQYADTLIDSMAERSDVRSENR